MKNKIGVPNAILIAAFFFAVTAYSYAGGELFDFHNPHFSPDGKLLAFDLCINNKCNNVIHNIDANTFTKLVDRQGRKIANLSFSPNGNAVLFVVINKTFWPWQKSSQQLVTGKRAETKLNLITSGGGLKMYPTFSDENTVLYWNMNEIPAKQSGGTYKETQLVELDIKTKRSQLLIPSQFDFYTPSPPISLNDDDLVVISDFGFHHPSTRYVDREKSKPRDELLILSKGKKTVMPLNTGIEASFRPVVIRQTGEIVFVGRVEQNEGQNGFVHDVFLLGLYGPTRLTRLRTFISGMDVTTDGKFLALVLSTPNRKTSDRKLIIYDVHTNIHREIHPKDIVEKLVDIVP